MCCHASIVIYRVVPFESISKDISFCVNFRRKMPKSYTKRDNIRTKFKWHNSDTSLENWDDEEFIYICIISTINLIKLTVDYKMIILFKKWWILYWLYRFATNFNLISEITCCYQLSIKMLYSLIIINCKLR